MLSETRSTWTKAHRLFPCGKRLGRFNLPLQRIRHHVTKSQLKELQKLPSSPARTRFAPSPTGFLHLGSLRTALYSYLLAKATGGQFLLRIEDTDQVRTAIGAEDRICRDLEWAGLQWDEGPEVGGSFGPYKQSERTAIYTQHAHQLLDRGHAYKCFCTPERLTALAEQRNQLGLPPDYDRTCAGLTNDEIRSREANGEKYVVRLKVPNVSPEYADLIYGLVGKGKTKKALYKVGERFYEDPVMLKSDGRPTYHLANVVDDHLMRITHVIRGVEWMPSTPKHIVLYNAFGWQPPQFAHVGLLIDKGGQKLSKRSRDIDLEAYRQAKFFPEAVVNYAALLGWSHSLGNDFLPMPKLIENFTLKFTKGNTVVETGKLKYLQKLYAQKLVAKDNPQLPGIIAEVESLVRGQYENTVNLDIDYSNLNAYISELLQVSASQFSTPLDFFQRNLYFFRTPARPVWPDEPLSRKEGHVANALQQLSDVSKEDWNEAVLREKLQSIIDWVEQRLDRSLIRVPLHARQDVSFVLRKILLAGNSGPSLVQTMRLLGQNVTLKRIAAAAAGIKPLDG